jgi:hypothetical protein
MHIKAQPLSRSLGDQEPFSLTLELINVMSSNTVKLDYIINPYSPQINIHLNPIENANDEKHI